MREAAAWLRRATKNAALDILRHREVKSRKASEILEATHPDDPFTAAEVYSELLQEIYHQIETLPPKGREIFKLRYLEGYSNDEIAARLQLSNQIVRDHLSRSLKALRIKMFEKKHLFTFFLFWITTK